MKDHICTTISSRGIIAKLITTQTRINVVKGELSTHIISTIQSHQPSRHIVETERMKGVKEFGACNCGSKKCIGNCTDAQVWRDRFILAYPVRRRLKREAELATRRPVTASAQVAS